VQRALTHGGRSRDSSVLAHLDSDYGSPRPIPDEVGLEVGGFREWLALVGPMTSPHEGLATPRVRSSAARR
jgi:hypothetical protein